MHNFYEKNHLKINNKIQTSINSEHLVFLGEYTEFRSPYTETQALLMYKHFILLK